MRFVAYFVLLLTFATGAPARAQDGADAREAFRRGTAAFEEEDYPLALSQFQAALDAGIEGPAVYYNIAVSHYRLGDYERAGDVFSLIADRYPAMRELAQYNLGLIAERRGERAEAEAYFRLALENSQDEQIRRLAQQKLSPNTVSAGNPWYSLIDIRFGYDDNVRLTPDDVPGLDGVSKESSLTELLAVISGPLSTNAGFRFDGTLYSSHYPDASFFDQDYLRLGLVYQWRWGRWLAETGPHVSRSTLDGDDYEERAGAGFRLRRSLTSQSSFSARYIHDDVESEAGRFAFVEGTHDWLEVRLDRQRARDRLTFSYSLESNNRGNTIATTRNKLSLRYRYSFSERWLLDLEGSFRRSSYGDSADPRDEHLTELSFGFTRNLKRDWALSGLVSVASNDAVAPYSYDRNRFSFGFGKTFY